MIRYLLDTSRILANERLPLHLAQVDLAATRARVIQDLSPINYERFILKLEDGARGIWDAEELRRALWNLAINAVKYGELDWADGYLAVLCGRDRKHRSLDLRRRVPN